MTEINKNIANIQGIAPKSQLKTEKTEKTKDNNKGLSVAGKALIGASALAVLVTGGLLYQKHANAKQLTKEIERRKKLLTNMVESQKPCEDFCKIFNPELLQGHIDEASKLGKKEQLARLKEISKTISSDRGFEMGLTSNSSYLKIDTKKLPQEVQDAIASKDQFKATKAYLKYCDNLFTPAKTKGQTVEEAISTVLGKDSTVKPHTYDVSKEADRIATAQYGAGGYKDITVLSDDTIASQLNHKNIVSLYSNMPKPADSANACITNGVVDGKPVVTLSYRASNRGDAFNGIHLMSPNSEMTPAQKDLLKLKESAKDLDISQFQRTTAPVDSNYSQTDYNVILSVIQDMASKVK